MLSFSLHILKLTFPHADFIRAILIALQRWGSIAESLDGINVIYASRSLCKAL
nr:MAG TPA: hypothetical protein [Caudoviricetes sp.]